MNKILQKRIEEAAIKVSDVCEPCDYGDPFCASCHRPYMYDAAKKMGEVILNKQWISVDEALPEDNELYFVAYKAMDGVLYSTGSYEKDIDEWYVDGFGFNAEVTHWMEIPSLKGGEK